MHAVVRGALLFSTFFSWLFALFSCAGTKSEIQAPHLRGIAPMPERYDFCVVDPKGCSQGIQELSFQRGETRDGPEIVLTGPLAAAPAVGKRSNSVPRRVMRAVDKAISGRPPPSPSAPLAPETSYPEAGHELVDLEVNLSIEAVDPRAAADRARAFTRDTGGSVVNEAFEDNAAEFGYALSIRVPSERARQLVDQLRTLGKVRSLETKAADLSRKVADADAVLRNLESALARYEELMKSAQSAHEMTEIERELDRVRTALDRVKTDIAWMQDRVARSTLYVRIARPVDELISHEAKLYPGLRLPYILDLEPSGATSHFIGGGVSVFVIRPFNFDLDFLTNTEDQPGSIDFFITSLGVELYSNLLGAGRRKFLNPYFGFRSGYANLGGDDALALGGSLGLELWKSKFAFIDLQSRLYALVATDQGTHLAFEPAATFNIAY